MLSLSGLQIRAALFRGIRTFFDGQDFLEVDTPLLHPVIIPEANISPFAVGKKYLQTSPEICMKRLLARGCSRIYQIAPCFRREEIGRLHHEEFTLLEWYRTGEDYFALMQDCEELLRSLTLELEQRFPGRIKPIPHGPWERLGVEEAFMRYAPCSLQQALEESKFDEILVEFIEPELGRNLPTFLMDYPAELASLSRLKPSDTSVAERFELYVDGIELANGFSELTDAKEQRSRFVAETALRQDESLVLPEKFLADLASLDHAAGIALGIDRLFMLLLGVDDISRAVSFSPSDL